MKCALSAVVAAFALGAAAGWAARDGRRVPPPPPPNSARHFEFAVVVPPDSGHDAEHAGRAARRP